MASSEPFTLCFRAFSYHLESNLLPLYETAQSEKRSLTMSLEKWTVLCRDIHTAWHTCANFHNYEQAETELNRLRAKNNDLWFTVARGSHLKYLNVEG